ncbi:hypothetical protein BDW22DRAFT_317834 [Trametopsis cervina]|nr:hypothetical protein BDW22DRAFT_317834 [Trametopsis cervina]
MSDLSNAVATLMGPLLITIFFAVLLYGIFLAQVFYYWTTYEGNKLPIKLWICVLCVLETTHTIICIHFIYHYFVLHYGDPVALKEIVWSIGASVSVEIVIVGFTQGFYVYRIWHISNKNRVITIILAIIVSMRVVISLFTSALTISFGTWVALQNSRLFRITANIGWVLCGLADTTITLTLIYYLYRGRKVCIGRTQNMLRKLAHYSITTGAVTLITSMVVLITFNLLKGNLLFGGLLEVLSKLYANSSLAMLNARRNVASTAANNEKITLELSRIRWASSPDTGTAADVVQIEKEATVFSDDVLGPHTLAITKDDASSLV